MREDQEKDRTRNIDPEALVRLAFAAARNSYSPYSQYSVGAALLTGSGEVYTGCNIENASYPAGICAERTAAVKAVSEGDQEFVAVAIVGYKHADGPGQGDEAYPCGICRQFLNEFACQGMKIYIARTEDHYVEHSLEELLPYDFGPSKLLKGDQNG